MFAKLQLSATWALGFRRFAVCAELVAARVVIDLAINLIVLSREVVDKLRFVSLRILLLDRLLVIDIEVNGFHFFHFEDRQSNRR